MVVIRLSRYGAKKAPKYRITVADQRKWRNGRVIEILGHYNPSHQEVAKKLVIDLENIKKWISQGAKPSSRVQKLISEAQVSLSVEKKS